MWLSLVAELLRDNSNICLTRLLKKSPRNREKKRKTNPQHFASTVCHQTIGPRPHFEMLLTPAYCFRGPCRIASGKWKRRDHHYASAECVHGHGVFFQHWKLCDKDLALNRGRCCYWCRNGDRYLLWLRQTVLLWRILRPHCHRLFQISSFCSHQLPRRMIEPQKRRPLGALIHLKTWCASCNRCTLRSTWVLPHLLFPEMQGLW